MSIRVMDFKYIPGENDAEYIRLLEQTLEIERTVTQKAVAKIREHRIEDFREACALIRLHAACEYGGRKAGMLSAIAVLTAAMADREET